jgi:hypothetical protein
MRLQFVQRRTVGDDSPVVTLVEVLLKNGERWSFDDRSHPDQFTSISINIKYVPTAI